jgi:periplasmic protein CpxP/Spy
MSSSTFFKPTASRRLVQAVLAATALSFAGIAAAQAPAGPASGPHAGHGGKGGMGGPGMERMAERGIDRMIKEVDGTPEQKAKLTQLAQTAQKDMQPLREQLQAARKKGMDLLAAPTVDRGALEKLRAEQTQLMDTISKRMLAHMADAAEVLTPAQRAKLAEKMKSRGEHRGRMHGGMHGGQGGHGGMHGGMGGWMR